MITQKELRQIAKQCALGAQANDATCNDLDSAADAIYITLVKELGRLKIFIDDRTEDYDNTPKPFGPLDRIADALMEDEDSD